MDVKDYLNPAEEKMELAVAYLDESLAHIRAGAGDKNFLSHRFASPRILNCAAVPCPSPP